MAVIEFKFAVGQKLRDTHTGFIGVVSVLTVARVTHGAWLENMHDGKIVEQWFPTERLEVAG